MTAEEVKNYFINGYIFSKKTGMTAQSFHNWMKWGRVPIESQVKIQRITEGELKADINHMK